MAHTPVNAVIPVAGSSAPARRGRARRPDHTRVVLDDVSKLIIEQLQQDGRRSYAAIGKAVGLSEAAVRQRVQRLLLPELGRIGQQPRHESDCRRLGALPDAHRWLALALYGRAMQRRLVPGLVVPGQ